MTNNPGIILVVDESATMRLDLTQVLTRAGHAVRAVGSGQEALDSYRKERADLVALDVVIEDMDGLEILQALKQTDPEVQALRISGTGTMFIPLFLATIRKIGAQGTLEKPFTDEALLQLVQILTDPAQGSNPQASPRHQACRTRRQRQARRTPALQRGGIQELLTMNN